MKDITIKGSRVKKEIWVFAGCLVFMELVNVYAVIRYDGRMIEVLKSLGYVFISACVIYVLLGVIRLLIKGIITIITKD